MHRRSLLTAGLLSGLALLAACGGSTADLSSALSGGKRLAFDWPPTVGEAYPDLVLRDQHGTWVTLSDHRGKVILIEPVGMT